MRSYLNKYYLVFPEENDAENPLADFLDLENNADLDELMTQFADKIKEDIEELQIDEKGKDLKLWVFVNNLIDSEIGEFLEDVLLEQLENIGMMFQATQWSSAEEEAFHWILDLPYKTEAKTLGQLEDIYEKALRGDYKEKGSIVMRKIRIITASNTKGLGKDFIQRIAHHPNVDTFHRTELYKLLPSLEDSVPITFWDKIDYQKEPWLTVAKIVAYEERMPLEGLKVVLEINNLPWKNNVEVEEMLESKLENCLDNYLPKLSKNELLIANNELTEIFASVKEEWLKNSLLRVVQDALLERDYPELMNNLQAILEGSNGMAINYYNLIKKNPDQGKMVYALTVGKVSFQKEFARMIYMDLIEGNNDIVECFGTYVRAILKEENSAFQRELEEEYGVVLTSDEIRDIRTGNSCGFTGFDKNDWLIGMKNFDSETLIREYINDN